MDYAVRIKDVYYEYTNHEGQTVKALNGVSLDIMRGEFVVIIGHNGSGKSTLAKHINALLTPKKGSVELLGTNITDNDRIWEIRQRAGMVFQNPDNQLVANVVEEDVAFGPENLAVPSQEIRQRVDTALKSVGMEDFAKSPPHHLSGGQKQRVAIAGIIAMKPDIIVLDEPTAMLDPSGRREVMDTVWMLNKEEKKTVVHITHFMEEASFADRVIVMEEGRIVLQGDPREVFSNIIPLRRIGLDVPQISELSHELQKEGIELPEGIITIEEMVNALCP